MASPLQQFEIYAIKPLALGGYDISFTNSSLFMLIAAGLVIALLASAIRKRDLVPGRLQSVAELSYLFIANQVKESVGTEGKRYFPVIFALFMFILAGNLLGMMPGAFTFTSHIVVTFALAAAVFIGCTLIAIIHHGPAKFFGFFLPSGAPLWIAPLLIVVELFAYLARPITLSVRLAANMMAGHIALKVIGSFVFALGAVSFAVGGIAPLALLIGLVAFEFFVALLQAYIFTVLTCVYLSDAIHLH